MLSHASKAALRAEVSCLGFRSWSMTDSPPHMPVLARSAPQRPPVSMQLPSLKKIQCCPHNPFVSSFDPSLPLHCPWRQSQSRSAWCRQRHRSRDNVLNQDWVLLKHHDSRVTSALAHQSQPDAIGSREDADCPVASSGLSGEESGVCRLHARFGVLKL